MKAKQETTLWSMTVRTVTLRTMTLLIALALLVTTTPLMASGEQTQPAEVGGYIKYQYYWNPEFQETASNAFIVRLKAATQINKSASLTFAGDGKLELGHSQLQGSAGLVEGYLDLRLGPLDLRAGKQLVAWGQTDGWNPTDNINPADYTVESAEPDARKLPVTALKADYYRGDGRLEVVVVPEFVPARMPPATLPPGLTITKGEKPAVAWENVEWAARLSYSRQGVDMSASYLSGWNDVPSIRIIPPAGMPPVPTLWEEYHRLRVVGADFAATKGQWSYRGEGAYFLTEDSDGKDPAVENPYLQYVLQAEHSVSDKLTLSGQFMQKVTANFDPATEYPPLPGMPAKERVSTSVMGRARYIFNESLSGDMTAVVNTAHGDYLVRPEVSYSPADALAFKVGAILFGGDTGTQFGSLKERGQRIYTEVKYSF